MTTKEKKLESLKSKHERGYLSSGEYLKERNKIINQVDWRDFFYLKKIGLAASIMLICGLGVYGFQKLDWISLFKSNRSLRLVSQRNLDELVTEMCGCYDSVLERPSQEPACAKLKNVIAERIIRDSLEAIQFDSLVAFCPNYPNCSSLISALSAFQQDSSRAHSRRLTAREWQFLRNESGRERDIQQSDDYYEEVQLKIKNTRRRIRINCNNTN
ncbi:hypothetical protein EGI22_16085 [Lacihabitans sp. LS3-19]|uniref:hypothetical protein n=1 Tax=Lacihabitans sp. LS3-19 TaxID=2487335 RepID=UPI0020CCB07B|nr:hypothetical protein [Lacihabitans sp. LS3-19]MCP9769423.1 hypothetical protein [Lacihabitans sp. LS3-19]